jgi:pyrroloquinoline quinone biosynthesis protein D
VTDVNVPSPQPVPQDVPLQLHRQYRLQWEESQQCHVLLFPEGMVKLQGGAGEIMKRIDGKTTLEQLIQGLESAFPGADLRKDVLEFVAIAYAKGWLARQPTS